jgi:hypothetical protein
LYTVIEVEFVACAIELAAVRRHLLKKYFARRSSSVGHYAA